MTMWSASIFICMASVLNSDCGNATAYEILRLHGFATREECQVRATHHFQATVVMGDRNVRIDCEQDGKVN